jgi:dTMP kinase
MRGKFITIEGCEGAGKTRQMRELAAYLEKKGVDVLVTREPGGNPISEQIRTVILAGKNTAMCDECEALLYAASRIQHLTETVIPAIKAGKTVLCDRFVHSSLAYQGYARGLGFEYVEQINQKAMDECMPDCTLFLDISPDKQRERIKVRNTPWLAERFFSEWIPMENVYFEKMGIKGRCDLVIPV